MRSEAVISGRQAHPRVLAEMLERAVSAATGKDTAIEGWQALLKPEDVVGLKFNQSGAVSLGTTVAMATALLDSLTAAGLKPENIVPIEVPPAVYQQSGTQRPRTFWQTHETDFGSGRDRLSTVLDQVTAIINVPFLKTHNIAGLTCCLKNLSHALVKHPARYHLNHCSPYIADIVAVPAIRGKLRLNVVNALRIVYDGGPEASDETTSEAGVLLASRDPVATDVVGLVELNQARQERGLESIARNDPRVAYLNVAGQRGLGWSEIHDVELERFHL